MRSSVDISRKPVRATPTQRRNEPCACGSGKKYKKCHGFVQHPLTTTQRPSWDGMPGYVDLDKVKDIRHGRAAVGALLAMAALGAR